MQTRNLLSVLFVTIITFGCNSNCKDVGCNDAGYCYDGACICDKWYSGESCSLLFNRHYEGTYISEANQMARIGIDSLIIQGFLNDEQSNHISQRSLYGFCNGFHIGSSVTRDIH